MADKLKGINDFLLEDWDMVKDSDIIPFKKLKVGDYVFDWAGNDYKVLGKIDSIGEMFRNPKRLGILENTIKLAKFSGLEGTGIEFCKEYVMIDMGAPYGVVLQAYGNHYKEYGMAGLNPNGIKALENED